MPDVQTGRSRPAILLFFSHGVGLQTWDEAGILDREVSYYKELAERIGPVQFLTYDRGGQAFDELVDRIAPLRVARNDTRLPYQIFGIVAPIRYFRSLRKAHVLKTNQFSGAWVGLIAKWLVRRPLVVRGGFIRSLNLERQGNISRPRRWLATFLEGLSLQGADLVIVTTSTDRDYLLDRYRLSPGRVQIVPNPIDVAKFRPDTREQEEPGLVVTVGRIAPEKNLSALVRAMESVEDARLVIVGRGPEEENIREAAGANVDLIGGVPNSEIPHLLSSAQVFVLASHYEGSPKALLEAMSCGKAVIGANSPGIREVIQDGVNGLLVEGTATALSAAIRRLLSDSALRMKLGSAAREYVQRTNSQSASVAIEADLLESLIDKS